MSVAMTNSLPHMMRSIRGARRPVAPSSGARGKSTAIGPTTRRSSRRRSSIYCVEVDPERVWIKGIRVAYKIVWLRENGFAKGNHTPIGEKLRRLQKLLCMSLPSMSGIVQPPALKNCGAAFRKFIGTTRPSILMVWQLIKRCYPQRGIKSAPNIIERFNCTLRQRVSRLVRFSMSFSKTVKNHIGAIKYFICSYNKEVIGFAEPALHL